VHPSEIKESDINRCSEPESALTLDPSALESERRVSEVEKVYRPAGLSNLELSVIGKQVKRILDQGRVCFLRDLGLDAKIVRYD
jgi:hypothetical protein